MFPDEALEPLAQRLPARDVLRLARVCRAWRQQLSRIVLTEKVKMEILDEDASHHAAAWLARNLHRTRDLELDCWMLVTPLPPQLLTAAPANGLVRLSFARFLTSQLPSLATCTALKELRVLDCDAVEELPPLDALTQLTRLEIDAARKLRALPSLSSCSALVELRLNSDYDLTALLSLSSCTALEALEVSTGGCCAKAELPQLSALTRLTRLELNDCKLDTALPGLDAFPRLRVLGLSHCNVEESQLLGLTACTGLEELRVVWIEHDPVHVAYLPPGLSAPPALLPALSALPALRQLCLQGYASAQRFPSLAGLTSLTCLRVADCRGGSARLEDLAGLASLVELEIHKCSMLQQLPSLASCEQLQALTIRSCPDLQALPDLSGCTRLETLSFIDCRRLQGAPDLSCCATLKEVAFCSGDDWCRAGWQTLPGWLMALISRGVKVVKHRKRHSNRSGVIVNNDNYDDDDDDDRSTGSGHGDSDDYDYDDDDDDDGDGDELPSELEHSD